MDPESRLDAVRYVGIQGGRIRTISDTALRAPVVLDAAGMVVAPGFIDLHAHGQTPENYRLQALDGVTSAFELEVGTADADRWYAARENQAAINYGVSVGHIPARMAVMGDSGGLLPSGPGGTRPATEAQIAQMKQIIARGLQRGAVAVGMGPTYTPAATQWEVLEMFRVAAKYGASVHVHVRGGTDTVAGFQEVIGASAITGAPLHIVHLNSSSTAQTARTLQLVAEARARHLDVTTECYPYTAGMTEIESALFNGYESRPDSDFTKLQWVATGERLNRQSFLRYRRQGGMVILYNNTEDMVKLAVTSPVTMIASDGHIENGKGHPRTAGTYSRVLGRYVREQGALGLMVALRKMSLMPAQRLEYRVPAMRDKGRIKVGAEADIVVFDPNTITDRSTYEQPAQPSVGVKHVLVGGVPVVRDGRFDETVKPGKAVRGIVR
ncbi:MAG: amidohydrolase family protein [Gemmatimonadetes bacterium]|nr:amidohydrolase family protein [Gemmatimonadota bacterium]